MRGRQIRSTWATPRTLAYSFSVESFGPEDKYGIGLKLGSDGVEFVNDFLKKFEDDGKWAEFYKICIADRTGVSATAEPPAIGA